MRSYSRFALHAAQLATQAGASVFVVGTELESVSARTSEWRALIAKIRARYSGTLTYAANWVHEAEQVGFWDLLDVVGIDAYMPLSEAEADPSLATIQEGWKQWYERILAVHTSTGLPVMFTELGYPSRLGAAKHPSREGEGQISQPLQQRLYEAAFRTWNPIQWFRGIWWWDWPADGGNPARDAGGYPPTGKLAERTLSDWQTHAPGGSAPG
jgi:hypothetical protein